MAPSLVGPRLWTVIFLETGLKEVPKYNCAAVFVSEAAAVQYIHDHIDQIKAAFPNEVWTVNHNEILLPKVFELRRDGYHFIAKIESTIVR